MATFRELIQFMDKSYATSTMNVWIFVSRIDNEHAPKLQYQGLLQTFSNTNLYDNDYANPDISTVESFEYNHTLHELTVHIRRYRD